MKLLTALLFNSIMLFNASFCYANGIESNEHLFGVAKEFVLSTMAPSSNGSVKITEAENNSFQLAKCQQPIQANLPASNNEQITSVELKCPDVGSWHIYYPITVEYFSKAIVAKHLIPARQEITDQDIDVSEMNKNQLYQGYFSEPEKVIGKESTHIIPAGTVLTNANIKSPILVHRDQVVTIIVKSNMIEVSMQGTAKSEGGLNDMIKVYNPSSKRTFDAVVTGSGKAQVTV